MKEVSVLCRNPFWLQTWDKKPTQIKRFCTKGILTELAAGETSEKFKMPVFWIVGVSSYGTNQPDDWCTHAQWTALFATRQNTALLFHPRNLIWAQRLGKSCLAMQQSTWHETKSFSRKSTQVLFSNTVWHYLCWELWVVVGILLSK